MMKDHKKAFTLIELLVVVAIIALLMSIVMPALRKAKDKGKDIVCRSHLKGIGVAIHLYLNDNESRAFNNRSSNGHLWHDDAGNIITPENTSWWGDAYWGVGYMSYSSDEKVFSCPSFVLKDVAELMYATDTNYQTTMTDLKHASGYALNSFFFRDPDLPSSDANRYNRKVGSLRSPSRFIITHDHMEPKIEGDSNGSDQGDMLYIPQGLSYNLPPYRTGSRTSYYSYIFRHCKVKQAWDEAWNDPSQRITRLSAVAASPNGNLNTLFLDGSADKITETTGENIPYSMYRGTK